MMLGSGQKEDGTQVLFMGLSLENIRRLVQGKPMVITREAHGEGVPEGWEILVVYGETEDDIVEMMKPALNPGVEIHRDPKLDKTL